MGGKAILLVILGLSSTLMIVSNNYSRISNLAVGHSVEYFEQAAGRNAAVSGANMACNEIFRNPNWKTGYTMVFEGVNLNVSVEDLDVVKKIKRINSVSTKDIDSPTEAYTLTNTVSVILQPSNFSKFAYYSADEGGTIYWTTGDTVWGPFHTQDYLRVSGKPVFFGSVSTKEKLIKKSSYDNPQFLSSFEAGVDMPINEDAVSDLNLSAEAGGFIFPSSFSYTETTGWGKKKKTVTVTEDVETVYLTFAGDNIKYRFREEDSWITESASTFSDNGVIYIKDAKLKIKGTVKGNFTVVCSGNNSYGNGDIYLEDDLVYNTDPLTNPNSTDILGLVAQNDVIISDNAANTDNKDINIHASIYCQNGGFGAENYSDRDPSGNINLIGGIIQKTRAAVGTFSGSTINHGFNKRYKYDERFMFSAPPKYPNTGSYEILSWYE